MNYNEFKNKVKESELLNGYIELDYIFKNSENEDEAIAAIKEEIQQQEVIYYYNAIKFLKEFDPSLSDSLEIAENWGYTVSSLNSEILATILLQSMLLEELEKIND